MSLAHLGKTATMGPMLQKEVESQLLSDLVAYGVKPTELAIDWSDSCQEGHCTQVLDGNLEELSSVTVKDPRGNVVAEGWMDFIHGGGDNPLFVFWLFLSLSRSGKWEEVKKKPTIPTHIWSRVPESTKRLCARTNEYDSRWANDPLVVSWRQTHAA